MLEDFQLAAIVKRADGPKLLRIPLVQDLQTTLATTWQAQFDAFTKGVTKIEFDAAYTPDDDECFVIKKYALPEWIARHSSADVNTLEAIGDNEETLSAISAIAGFARIERKEFVLFQNFVRSRVIQPGRFLFLEQNTYKSAARAGFALDSKLSALYKAEEKELLFATFRTVNSFLPLMDVYAEASAEEIREVLAHKNLAPTNVDAFAEEPNQWFRKHFALLHKSAVLDDFSPKQIQSHARGYPVQVRIQGGKIVFPEEKAEARKLLQFLTEELFKGPITDTLYETNSKRKAG